MKPSRRAQFAAAITLSKGKMHEYAVPEAFHLALPENLDLEMQFPFAVGTIGDFASETVAQAIGIDRGTDTSRNEVIFSAQVLQAFDDSLLNNKIASDLRLLAAAGFYLGDVPGNATVQIAKLDSLTNWRTDPFASAIKVALDKPWIHTDELSNASRAIDILKALQNHFNGLTANSDALDAIRHLHNWAYASASAHDLLMVDVLSAVAVARIANSAWTLLPTLSDLPLKEWTPYLSRPNSIKEMWPSQRMVGKAGLYKGQSGVVQMPTSAGKSRATELIIRSAFLSTRTKLALVVAPFRALCQEIAGDLEKTFRDDGFHVNQLSDALQPDVFLDFADIEIESRPQVVVLTPEKLLYMLRQEPDIVKRAGLVIYDEGHQFDTGTRGVTYELLLTSIRRMLPNNAQSVMISAVMQNSTAIAKWLLNDESKIVSDQMLQARRLVAFASLPKGRIGQLQFNVASAGEQEFFVPRVIESVRQPRLQGEKKDRFFPTRDSGSIALYLGLKILGNGGVAIYAGQKRSAAKIVREAVEDAFERGIPLPAPSEYSDADEIRRFVNLYAKNFGDASYLTRAAALGIFAHHGNTPQGIRTAIEYAMRHRLIRMIVCTSTLAQGVNLPIRYLLVTSAMQGRELIKARDFHNLMGRAGRAGMYGEGTVIFTDHRLYDERTTQSHRWTSSVNLINSKGEELAGSSLLSLFDPMQNDTGARRLSAPSPAEIVTNIVNHWNQLYEAVGTLSEELLRNKFSVTSLREQLSEKKRIIEAVESFLMTYRSDVDFDAFVSHAKTLASETLAYSLATDEQKVLLVDVFESVALRIQTQVPDVATQNRFGRTLLGLDHSMSIEEWVIDNLSALELVDSSDSLFELAFPLLRQLSTEKRMSDTTPPSAIDALAHGWLAGHSFALLLAQLDLLNASYPYGKNKRKFDLDLVVDLCEQTFGFEFALVLASLKESFLNHADEDRKDQFSEFSDLLQKRLKYGLPNGHCIAVYEAGFSERVLAQSLSEILPKDVPDNRGTARSLVRQHSRTVEPILLNFPSYFADVFRTIVT